MRDFDVSDLPPGGPATGCAHTRCEAFLAHVERWIESAATVEDTLRNRRESLAAHMRAQWGADIPPLTLWLAVGTVVERRLRAAGMP